MISIAAGVLLIASARTPHRSDVGLHMIQFNSSPVDAILRSENSTLARNDIADPLEGALSKDLASIRQVRHVLTHKVNESLLVWIALDNPEPDIRHLIYEKELGLINGFPDVEFDFNLVPAMGRAAREIVSNANVVYSRLD